MANAKVRYVREVKDMGKRMFKAEWSLQSVPTVGGAAVPFFYQIMDVTDDANWKPMSEPLPLADFMLYWDGFMLCAREMCA